MKWNKFFATNKYLFAPWRLGIVAVYPRACCSSAVLSIGGKSLPRRSARRKIPRQAFGDKEYLAGAFASKICDKKDAPAPLCCSEILGVVHAPSEVNASASYHPGVCPPSRTRHWNFGVCERFQHSLKVTPGRT